LVAQQERVQKVVLGATAPGIARDPVRDALATEALLALSSDWAFMVSKDSAADYARERASGHAARVEELAGLLGAGRRRAAERRIASWGGDDAVFGHLDARHLLATPRP
jgi:1,4-alpha-glucan branching enzyme